MIGSVSVGGQATDTLSALLQIISDPEKHKAALAELKKQAEEAQTATATLKASQAEATAGRAEAEKALTAKHDEVTKALADLEVKRRNHVANVGDYGQRKARLDHDTAALAGKLTAVDAAARDLNARAEQHETEHEKKSVALSAREQRVKDREAALETREAELATGEADYAERMGALRKLAG